MFLFIITKRNVDKNIICQHLYTNVELKKRKEIIILISIVVITVEISVKNKGTLLGSKDLGFMYLES